MSTALQERGSFLAAPRGMGCHPLPGEQPARSHLPVVIPCIHLRISSKSQAHPVHQQQREDPKQDAGAGPFYDSELLAP